MKKIMITLVLLWSLQMFSHEGEHGPKINDGGKYGGLVAAVISKTDMKNANQAKVLYKAELVRAADGTARIYLYNPDMKPADFNKFATTANALLVTKVKKKFKETRFTFTLQNNYYIAQLPKIEKKPYSIDVEIKTSETELSMGFENLD